MKKPIIKKTKLDKVITDIVYMYCYGYSYKHAGAVSSYNTKTGAFRDYRLEEARIILEAYLNDQ